jgi:hypothetical protein
MTYPFRRLAEACEEAHVEAGSPKRHEVDPLVFGACNAAPLLGLLSPYDAVADDFPVNSDYLDTTGVWDARLLYLYLRAEETERP